MNDICNFIPPLKYDSNLEFLHFVYEANIQKQHQPFIHSNFYVHIVFKGNAVLRVNGTESEIESGDVFFTFPHQRFEIDTNNKFIYMYISFTGRIAFRLLYDLGITEENLVFKNHGHLLNFWLDAVKRINPDNANILTESVLMYTLSFMNNSCSSENAPDKFDSILEYINHNFTSNDMSLKKVSEIFFYSEKYLSSLFFKKTGVKFSHHLNNLRIRHAAELFDKGNSNISEVARKCGYSDQFYFSKVFKKISGKSPSKYIEK